MVFPRAFRVGLFLILVLSLQIVPRSAIAKEKTEVANRKAILFQRDVLPIFQKHCFKCHGPKKQESGLRLDQRSQLIRGGDSGEPAIQVGNGAKSYLVQLVSGKLQGEIMPPEGPRLSAAEVSVLKTWIDQGAKWPGQHKAKGNSSSRLKHWSFQPIKRPALPRVKRTDWVRTPIDSFILAKLESEKLSPSSRAGRATLIRRLSFVIRGIPPTPAEVNDFLNDKRLDAFSRLVNRFLADPRYGERWATHWLDIARFAETTGFETNVPRPHAWRYRDYVIRSFNDDVPYNRFVREQLAGDALGADVATGFIVAGPYDRVKSPDINLTLAQRQNELHDMINTTSSAFLGLTVACARCHNHKFDPVTQRDYYGFQAVFAGVQHGDRKISVGTSPEKRERIANAQQTLARYRQELSLLKTSLKTSPGSASMGGTIVLDDEHLADNAKSRGVQLLAKKQGHGVNPAGTQKGQRDDPGGLTRLPNISRGRYTWWNAQPNSDLMLYRPRARGRFRLWLSWGCGHETHATDVQYLLDRDGNPQTRDDQTLLAIINQQLFADKSRSPRKQPLWSGFHLAGTHELTANSSILIRNGKSRRPVTADVILLEEVTSNADSSRALATVPRLRGPVNPKRNEETFPPVLAKFVRFTILKTNRSEPCLDELEIWTDEDTPRNVAHFKLGPKVSSSGNYSGNPKHQLKHINDGQVGNARSWISNTNGRGWVQFELANPVRIHRIVWGRDRQGRYADRLPTSYRIEAAIEPGHWRTIASSDNRLPYGMKTEQVHAYQFAGLSREKLQQAKKLIADIARLEKRLSEQTQPVLAYAGTFQQPGPTHRLFRGDPLAKREQVSPGAVTALGRPIKLAKNSPEQARRMALANWIASEKNPLTARVMVNRIWQHHFGRGLVPTPSDFGKMGVAPSHPLLLDWLASEFMRSGWSVKHLHRLILNSAVWQQSSLPIKRAVKIDAGSVFLWRFPPRRLEAEAIRDAILSVTGVLDSRMQGPGFSAFKPNTNYVRVYDPKTQWGPNEWRRMIYMTKVRMERDAVFGAFDCPDAGQATAARSRSTTPLQALSLLNSNFTLQQAELLANNLKATAGNEIEQQIKLLYQRAYSRAPSTDELREVTAFAKRYGMRALCRAVLNSNEFLFLQ
ncbi:MAG: hypothetical protein Tsb009_25050 [Planctomycetaceae bacterium]